MTLVRNFKPGDIQRTATEEDYSGMHHQLEEALRQANAKLRLLSAITRHDINNQLVALTGYLDLIRARNPSLARDLEKVGAAAEQIGAMIRFSREYEEIGTREPVWQNCRNLVAMAAAQMHPCPVQLENEIPDDLEIFADPLVIRVIYNLLDNAVRYGDTLSVIRFTAGEPCDGLLLICEDNGIGVPKEDKDRIFDRGFGRNTGMGLFLAREILSITGISICETGEPGKGARFEMAVPAGGFRQTHRMIPAKMQAEYPVPVKGRQLNPIVRERACSTDSREAGAGGQLILMPGR